MPSELTVNLQVELALRLLLGLVLGAAIGLERELDRQPAGFRTHSLVALGACLFTIVSGYAFLGSGADPTRIAAQIVTGIAFLGAGAIIRQGRSIRGLTTAATLWVVAAIGMATGAGYYSAAVLATVIVLVSLWPLRLVTYRLLVRFRPEEGRLLVTLPPATAAAPLLEELERFGARVDTLEIEDAQNERVVVATVHLEDRARAGEMVERVSDLDEVRRAEWTA